MTTRQQELLKLIVEEYVKSAAPVGSLTISRNFGYSPATIRAEMVELEDSGYITHPHTSSGRVPTDRGYRFYVDSLITEREARAEADRRRRALKQRLQSAQAFDHALQTAVNSLVELTHNAAAVSVGNRTYMSGLASLFSQPEFRSNANRLYGVAQLLDNFNPWLLETSPPRRINVYIGRENPIGKGSGCSLVVARFRSPLSEHSYIGVIGPTRQSYSQAIALVQLVAETLEEQFNA